MRGANEAFGKGKWAGEGKQMLRRSFGRGIFKCRLRKDRSEQNSGSRERYPGEYHVQNRLDADDERGGENRNTRANVSSRLAEACV